MNSVKKNSNLIILSRVSPVCVTYEGVTPCTLVCARLVT
jgi:hypothetical protein